MYYYLISEDWGDYDMQGEAFAVLRHRRKYSDEQMEAFRVEAYRAVIPKQGRMRGEGAYFPSEDDTYVDDAAEYLVKNHGFEIIEFTATAST